MGYRCGDGTCDYWNRCANNDSDKCEVCDRNSKATTRDYFDGEEDEEESE
jgi:hypothetical protein